MVISKLKDEIELKQVSLTKYVGDAISKVNLANVETLPTQKPVEKSSSNYGSICAVAGAILTVYGLSGEGKGLVTTIGLIALAGGVASMMRQRSPEKDGSPRPTIDYFAEKQKLYSAANNIYDKLYSEWKDFVKQERDELQSAISNLSEVDVDTRSALMDKSIRQVGLDFNMTSLITELGELEKSKDMAKFHEYLTVLQNKFEAAITTAKKQQLALLDELGAIYKF